MVSSANVLVLVCSTSPIRLNIAGESGNGNMHFPRWRPNWKIKEHPSPQYRDSDYYTYVYPTLAILPYPLYSHLKGQYVQIWHRRLIYAFQFYFTVYFRVQSLQELKKLGRKMAGISCGFHYVPTSGSYRGDFKNTFRTVENTSYFVPLSSKRIKKYVILYLSVFLYSNEWQAFLRIVKAALYSIWPCAVCNYFDIVQVLFSINYIS